MRAPLLVGSALLFAGCVASPELGTRSEAIIGGTETSDYPAVMMVIAQVPGSSLASICTSTLISPHVVLTAAHCLDPRVVGANAQFHVFTGTDINLAHAADLLAAKATHVNSDFDPNKVTDGGDIGVVVLNDALSIEPMAMNRTALTSELIGAPATLVGYGKNDGGDTAGSSAGIKREVMTAMGSYSDRLVRFGEAGMTTCEGDSGGPGLMSIAGATVIVGVVSFGSQLCDQDAFDTRVDAYTDWVDGYIEDADPGFLEGHGIAPPDHGCAMSGREARLGWVWLVAVALFALRRRISLFTGQRFR